MAKKSLIRRIFEKIVTYMNYLACACTAILCVWILVDIFGRFLFNSPIPGTAELAGNVIVGVLFLGVTSVEMRREHIRSDLIINKVGIRPGLIIEIISTIMGLIVFCFGIIASWSTMTEAWRIMEYDGEGSIHIPTYPFKTIVVIGCACMVIQLLFNLKDTIVYFIHNKPLPSGDDTSGDGTGGTPEKEAGATAVLVEEEVLVLTEEGGQA